LQTLFWLGFSTAAAGVITAGLLVMRFSKEPNLTAIPASAFRRSKGLIILYFVLFAATVGLMVTLEIVRRHP
jgi:hypothetical protein